MEQAITPLVKRLEVLAEVLERVLPTLRPVEQLVYLQGLWLAGLQPGETCRVTQEQLARRTGLSRGTIQTALKGLHRKGLLTITASGGKTPSHLQVHLPKGMGGFLPLWLKALLPTPASGRQTGTWAPEPPRPRLQDRLDPEDRALLEAILDGLSPREREELRQEAMAHLREEDPGAAEDPAAVEAMGVELACVKFLGPARLEKYREEGGSRRTEV